MRILVDLYSVGGFAVRAHSRLLGLVDEDGQPLRCPELIEKVENDVLYYGHVVERDRQEVVRRVTKATTLRTFVCASCGLRDPALEYCEEIVDARCGNVPDWLVVPAHALAELDDAPPICLLDRHHVSMQLARRRLHNMYTHADKTLHLVPEAVQPLPDGSISIHLCKGYGGCHHGWAASGASTAPPGPGCVAPVGGSDGGPALQQQPMTPDRGPGQRAGPSQPEAQPSATGGTAPDPIPAQAEPCAHAALYNTGAPTHSIAAGSDYGRLEDLRDVLGPRADKSGVPMPPVSALEQLVLSRARLHGMVIKLRVHERDTYTSQLFGHTMVFPHARVRSPTGTEPVLDKEVLLDILKSCQVNFIGPAGAQPTAPATCAQHRHVLFCAPPARAHVTRAYAAQRRP